MTGGKGKRGENMADGTHDVIRARRFELVDEGGTIRAVLSAEPGLAWGLAIADEDGNAVASVGLNPRTGEPFVMLQDAHTEAGIMATIGSPDARQHVRCAVSLSDDKGQERIMLMLDEDGNPSILSLDENGAPTVP